MDYSVFDSLLDSVFVIDENRCIVYCNVTAAGFCGSSVRRLTKGLKIFEVLDFADPQLFVMPKGTVGQDTAMPLCEVEFKNLISNKSGKLQLVIQPFLEETNPLWVIILRDVTLEEVLHGKYRAELEQKEKYILDLKSAQEKLELYSKNLEKMVAERTAELQNANQVLNAIMDSLGQGFLVFDGTGTCASVYTLACIDVLECRPAGMKVWDVLKLQSNARNQFIKWAGATFQEALPFDTMVELAPKQFFHSQNRYVTLNYYPLRDCNDKMTSMVLVATDKTAEYEAGVALERERNNAQMVMRIIRSRDQFSQFLNATRQLITKLQTSLQVEDTTKLDIFYLFRELHTLEGEAASYSISALQMASRKVQEILEPIKKGEVVDPKQTLTRLVLGMKDIAAVFNHFIKEHQDFFEVLGFEKDRQIEVALTKVLAFRKHLQRYGEQPGLVQDFEDDFMRVPIKNYLKPLEDAAMAVAAKQSKQLKPVKFETDAVYVLVDSYENLFSVLIHAIRNAVDHGLEDGFERSASGKPEAGEITVRAQWTTKNSGRWLKISIRDDGRGIDADRIRARLSERDPSISWADKSDDEVIQHVFDAGLSSRDEVTEFSGRGVGMDAILNEARRLGGEATVESKPGQGSTLTVEVPDQSEQSLRVGA